jgi:predicted DNA-binding transcriptional regulator AlpA
MNHQRAAFVPLSKQAVADILGISVRSVENWINEGILPTPVKLGNRVYWHPDVFYEWLSNRLKASPVEAVEATPMALTRKSRQRGSEAVVVENLRASTDSKLARLQAIPPRPSVAHP